MGSQIVEGGITENVEEAESAAEGAILTGIMEGGLNRNEGLAEGGIVAEHITEGGEANA